MEIFLVRHTTPDIDQGICYGQSDISLAKNFQTEREKLLLHLPVTFDQCFSSPLIRCAELATSISKSIIVDDRLKEVNFGDWEMKRWSELNSLDLNRWMNDFVNECPPNGESLIQLYQRVGQFITELNQGKFSKLLIVTHAGVIRCFLAHILQIPLENIFRMKINYGSVSLVEINDSTSFIHYMNKL